MGTRYDINNDLFVVFPNRNSFVKADTPQTLLFCYPGIIYIYIFYWWLVRLVRTPNPFTGPNTAAACFWTLQQEGYTGGSYAAYREGEVDVTTDGVNMVVCVVPPVGESQFASASVEAPADGDTVAVEIAIWDTDHRTQVPYRCVEAQTRSNLRTRGQAVCGSK